MKRSRWIPTTLVATGYVWASDLRWLTALALLGAALSSANLHAEPVPSQPIPPPPIHGPSPSAAVGWSLLATAVPVIVGIQMMDTRGNTYEERQQNAGTGALLVLGGAIAGPSAGYFYGGCPAAGWTGTLGRGVVAAVGLTSLVYAYSETSDAAYVYPSLVGSSLIILAWDAWDLARVGGRVREANERRARTATLAPQVIPVALDHGRTPGLAVSVKF